MNILRTFFGVIVLLAFISTSFADYVIDFVVGNVKIKSGKKNLEANMDYVLKKGDTVVVGKDSECIISVYQKGYIKLEENSSITFENLQAISSQGTFDKVSTKGNVLFTVSGVFSPKKVLAIKSKTAYATVRGTEFAMEIDEDSTTLYVLEGSVYITPNVKVSESKLYSISTPINENEKVEITSLDVINATTVLDKAGEEGLISLIKSKKKSLIESEKERFSLRLNALKEIHKKKKEEMKNKMKEYKKDPSKLFEE